MGATSAVETFNINGQNLMCGTFSTGIFTRPASEVITSVKEINNNNQLNYNLSQNYPNPFNPTTVINYSIPKDGFVSLKVYNALGEQVADLVNGYVKAGNHNVTFNADRLSSGVYYYRIETNNNVLVKKMILLK